MKKLVILLLFISTLFATNNAEVVAVYSSVVDYLGKTHIDVINDFGPPNAMLPVRQKLEQKDDVVFNYNQSFWYFYNNRVYRVLFSSEYDGEVYHGMTIGAKKSSLTNTFGNDYRIETDGLVWQKLGYLIVAVMDKKNRLERIWFIYEGDK